MYNVKQGGLNSQCEVGGSHFKFTMDEARGS